MTLSRIAEDLLQLSETGSASWHTLYSVTGLAGKLLTQAIDMGAFTGSEWAILRYDVEMAIAGRLPHQRATGPFTPHWHVLNRVDYHARDRLNLPYGKVVEWGLDPTNAAGWFYDTCRMLAYQLEQMEKIQFSAGAKLPEPTKAALKPEAKLPEASLDRKLFLLLCDHHGFDLEDQSSRLRNLTPVRAKGLYRKVAKEFDLEPTDSAIGPAVSKSFKRLFQATVLKGHKTYIEYCRREGMLRNWFLSKSGNESAVGTVGRLEFVPAGERVAK